MTATHYYDSQTGEKAVFADFEIEAEMAWVGAHRAAVYVGTAEVPQRIIDSVVEGILEEKK